MKKRTILWLFLTVTVILSLSFCAFSAYDGCESYAGSNIGAHNYINAARWSKPVESYLVPASGSRLMRFQYVAGEKKILAEYYSTDFTFIERKVIAPELPIFGGFYAFNNYYYILTGQKNPDESDSVEVFRVTKYDQNWNRLAAASLKECNTTVPFDAGSARFAHSGKYLLIRTCHEMYRSSDGYHHQANVTIQIDTSTMTVTDEQTDDSNNAYGYVSHSFNQFIGVDDGKIVAVDHGDAYPRSIALTKYSTALSSGSFGSSSGNCKVYDMLKISGSIGDNDTYCTVGGFVISDKGYLVAGSARKSASSTAQNIYISYLSKNSNTPALKWITDYTDASVSNPHLVAMGAGRWLLLWQKGENVFYTEISASGDTMGQIYHLEGDLSDCAPVVFGGKLVWYTWKDGNITFYSISPASLAFPQTKELNFGHDYVPNGSASQGKINLRCRVCGSVKTGSVPVDFMIYWPASGNWYTSQPKASYHPDSRIDIMVEYTAKDFNEYVVESSDSSVVKVNKDGSLLTGKEGKAKVIVRSKYSSAVCEEYSVVVSHNVKRTVQSSPTCTVQGKTLVKCTECSYSVTEITEALGHAFGESVQTKKPTCTASGTKKKTCSVCGETVIEDIPATGHSEITVSAVAPTCTKSGKTAGKKCSVCGTTTVAQETVPALGHNLGAYQVTKKATCTAMGKETATCSRCDYEKSRDIEKAPHSEVTVKAVAPTCTKSGKTAGKKCSVCGTTTVAQETVPALGHNLGAYKVTKKATCTAMGKETASCSRCDYEKSRDIEKAPHSEVTVKAVAPTCTKSGKTAGKKCSVCGTTTVAQETVPALGHNLGAYQVTKKATCTAMGKETATCSRCDYEKSRDIAKVPHSEVTVTAVAPTCTKSGKTAGKKCSVCGTTTVAQETVPALGHNLGAYKVIKKATCTAMGKETATCSRCDYEKSRDIAKAPHSEVTVKSVAPTCTKSGKTAGKKCSVCGTTTVAQETVPALGHNLGAYQVTKKATCTAMGKETASCSRCDYEKSRDIAKAPHTEITVSAVAPTCTKSGKTAGKKCSVCGTTTVAQETVSALGHNLGAYQVTKKATCTAMGKETATCSRCDYEKSRDIEKAPHSEVTVKAVAATCTKSGKTAGKKCSVCGTTTVAQETVPALGHNLGAYQVTKKATCTAMGKETATCSRCDYEKSRDVAKAPHSEVTVKAVAPTCTKSGKTAGKKCSVCGTTTVAQETVPALGHNLGAYKVTKKATCTAMGKETATCSRCDYEKSRDIAKAPHSEVTVKAVAPTCTKSGKTAGKKCSVCGKITVAQETVPAKGHKAKTELTRATQTTNGKLRKTCSVCEAYISSQVIYKVTDFRMTSAYVYDGKVKTPLPVVRDEKGNTLKKDRDYVLSYSAGRKNIGQYAVKITLIGNYSSGKTLSFTVTPSKTAKISASPAASAIKLTWSKVKYATGYRVFVADSKTGKYKTVGTTSENTLTIQRLSPGTAYRFAVRAYSKVGSKVIWGAEYTVIQCVTKPLTPTLKVTAGKGSAALIWKKVSCTGYQVYVSTEKDRGYQKIATVKGASTVKLSHKGLKSGQVYYFKIRAFKQLGNGYVYSPLSKAVAVTIQ